MPFEVSVPVVAEDVITPTPEKVKVIKTKGAVVKV
jgi:hypothetical protein